MCRANSENQVTVVVEDKGTLSLDLDDFENFGEFIDELYNRLGYETPIQFPDDVCVKYNSKFQHIDDIENYLSNS